MHHHSTIRNIVAAISDKIPGTSLAVAVSQEQHGGHQAAGGGYRYRCQHRSVTRVPAVLRVPPRRHLRPPAPPPRRPGPARPPAAGPPPGRQVRGEGGLGGPGGQRRGRGGEAGAPGEAAAAQPAHHPRAGLQQPLPGPGRHLAARPAAPRPGAAGEGGAATHRHHPRPLGAAAEGWLPSGGAS